MDVSTDSGPEVEEVEEKDPLALDDDEGAELEAVDPYDGPIIPRQTCQLCLTRPRLFIHTWKQILWLSVDDNCSCD